MEANTSKVRRRSALAVASLMAAALCAVFACVPHVEARPQRSEAGERERAFELYDAGKFAAAAPLLERVVAADPEDAAALARLGAVVASVSVSIADPKARAALRLRARALLLRAKELGDSSALVASSLAALPADGSDFVFSSRKDVDAAVREGEAAFVRGEYEKAIVGYRRALALDPKQYEAALFVGDAYLRLRKLHEAAGWFDRAATIDPDRETAYRYWGDALLDAGKIEEARGKYIEAVLAEPYNPHALEGLLAWAERAHVTLKEPRIDPPSVVTTDGSVTTIDPAAADREDGSSAWALYGVIRSAWRRADFEKRFPAEKTHRHSLPEEADALRAVADTVREDLKTGSLTRETVAPSLARLVSLDDAGLLEAFVLLSRADEGIMRDYASYRANNRDKLRRYISEYLAPAHAKDFGD